METVALILLGLFFIAIFYFLDKRSKFMLMAIMLIGIKSYALNRGEIRSIIRDLVRDASTDSSKQHWTDSEINDYINIAQKRIASLTWCQQNYYDLSISSHFAVYTVTDTVFTITRVTIDNKAIEETTLQKLDAGNSEWDVNVTSAEPTEYYIFQSTGTNMKIGFYPPPDQNYTARIYYYEIASDMTSDSDIPFRGIKQDEPYHYLICLWVSAQLSAIDDRPNMAKYYMSLYQFQISNMVRDLGYKPNYIGTVSGEMK